MSVRALIRSDSGVAVIEAAFALPILIMLIWIVLQFGLLFRATAGIQHALGEGARAATIWPEPGVTDIEARVEAAVYGIGPGSFVVPTPVSGTDCDDNCVDVTVRYTQVLDLLFLPSPTITIERTKRVWMAGD